MLHREIKKLGNMEKKSSDIEERMFMCFHRDPEGIADLGPL